MSRPTNRECLLPEIGDVDREAGEFWVQNPFQMPAGGHNLSAFERNRLYLNVDGHSFIDGSFTSTVDLDSDSRSAIVGDFNSDGAPDLLVGSVGGGPLRLFQNQAASSANFLRIKLKGIRSNAPGIGSRIVIHCGQRQIVRDIFPVNGFMGQGPPELIVGLADAQHIDRLEVRWPTGIVQEFSDLSVNGTVLITEGSDHVEVLRP